MPGNDDNNDEDEAGVSSSSTEALRQPAARGTTPVVSVPAWSPFGAGGPRRCSFCARREDAVRHLVRARDAYICDECVALAAEAITTAPPDQRLVRIRPRPSGPEDRDAAEEAIERAFETVLGGDAPGDAERCELIEGGSNLAPVMQQVRERFPARQHMDMFIEHIRFLGVDEAEVQFVLLFPDGAPMSRLPSTGHAVLVDGRWKVARETWCGLVARIGVYCPPPPE